MAKIKILKDINVFGVKFYKDEVVEATQEINTDTKLPMNGWFTVIRNGKKNTITELENIQVPDSTPLTINNQLNNIVQNVGDNFETGIKDYIKSVRIAGGLGLIGGLGFAYYRKSSTAGYFGWGILFSTLASIAMLYYKTKVVVKKLDNLTTTLDNMHPLPLPPSQIPHPSPISDLEKWFSNVLNDFSFFAKQNPTMMSGGIDITAQTNKFKKLLSDNERKFYIEYLKAYLIAIRQMIGKTPEQAVFISASIETTTRSLMNKYNLTEDRVRFITQG